MDMNAHTLTLSQVYDPSARRDIGYFLSPATAILSHGRTKEANFLDLELLSDLGTDWYWLVRSLDYKHCHAIWCAWVAVVAVDIYVMRMTRRRKEPQGEGEHDFGWQALR